MNIRTKAIHFNADQKLIDHIESKLERLNKYFDKIISVDVTLKLQNTGKVQEKHVEVLVKVPGTTLIAKEKDKTFETAYDKVSGNLKRQILRLKEKVKSH